MTSSPSRRSPRLRRTALWLLIYLLLLAASNVVRWRAASGSLPPDPSVELRAVDAERTLEQPVHVAYRDYPATRPDAPVVLLLHGSPGRGKDFARVASALAGHYRIIVPDLPGFGASTRRVPDYSIRAHARYAHELLLRLGVDRAHLVGFSMGGGVALELYDIAPESIRSITLISSIGVQELELLGDYRLNHLVHGAQLGLLWALHESVPHFGLLDGFMLNVPYARNFFDTDQRPLRATLGRVEPPLLVLHGRKDFLVHPSAALEHHRLVPHSELLMVEESHFLVFTRPERTANQLLEFLERVDSGRAASRADATAERLVEAAEPFDPSASPPSAGLALLLKMVLIAVATLVSEDLTCVAVGLLVAQGRIELVPGVLACCAGIFVGDVLLYLAGRLIGRPALRRAPVRWLIDAEQVEAASTWFRARGPVVILLSRFLPGTRLPTYFAAGTLNTGFWSFCFYFGIAVAAWTPLLVGTSMLIGERAFGYFEWFQRHTLPALLLLGAWILVVIKLILPLTTFRGRRRFVAAWRRMRNSEFWPPWAFYPPVVAYVIWLGLRYRSPLLFSAANPAMPAGGVVAEPKGEILHGLASAGELVARTRRVVADDEPAERVRQVRAFMAEEDLAFPVVLKPDLGQRGSGVAVIRSERQLEAYLTRSDFDVLAQEYVPGLEYGIFYYRFPDEPSGRIFSITQKRLPEVRGDGRHTLEQLILRDRRAVCMASHYLSRQAGQLERVPGPGETVRLVELGTHCRGAVFLDGGHLATPELERVIDTVSQGYRGFYFGRYDLKVPRADDLKRGRGFKIIELNGVTSEATHIYDPKVPLWGKYRVLFEQWHLAFEIGRQNRRRGVRPAKPLELLRLLRTYRRAAQSHEGTATAKP